MKKVITGFLKIVGELVKVTTSEIVQGNSDIQELESRLAALDYNKQDSIDDLETIRSNAAAGASLSSKVTVNKTRIDELEAENKELKQKIEEIKAGGVASSIYIKDWSE